ncbi:MAG: hypothetical protein NT018_04600 [Armatimonadetes bacterium]|nr:hypothetical protein [Armatimonadota bacterium]
MRWFEQHLERLDWPLLTLELRRSRRSAKIFGQMLWISIGFLVYGLLMFAMFAMCAPAVLKVNTNDSDLVVFLTMVIALWRSLFSFFVVPSYSARMISSEKENRSFEHLALTSLSAKDIVIQKAALPIFYSLAITVVLLPLDIVVLAFSGALQYCFVGSLGFVCQVALYTGIGILSSCLCNNTRSASVITYLTIIFAPISSASLWARPWFSLGALNVDVVPQEIDLWLIRVVLSILISIAVAALCFYLAVGKIERLRCSV